VNGSSRNSVGATAQQVIHKIQFISPVDHSVVSKLENGISPTRHLTEKKESPIVATDNAPYRSRLRPGINVADDPTEAAGGHFGGSAVSQPSGIRLFQARC
jgi:hypothetical protein